MDTPPTALVPILKAIFWFVLLGVLPMLGAAILSWDYSIVSSVVLAGYFVGSVPAALAGLIFALGLVLARRADIALSLGRVVCAGAASALLGVACVVMFMMLRFPGPAGEGATIGLLFLAIPAVIAGTLAAVGAWLNIRRHPYFSAIRRPDAPGWDASDDDRAARHLDPAPAPLAPAPGPVSRDPTSV